MTILLKTAREALSQIRETRLREVMYLVAATDALIAQAEFRDKLMQRIITAMLGTDHEQSDLELKTIQRELSE